MTSKEDWESVYSTKAANAVSWFQPHAEISRRLIRATGAPVDGSIIDIGGGASTLVDDLLEDGFKNVTVLDIITTFGPERPERCSGLPVCHYDATTLSAELGDDVVLAESLFDVHHTPGGAPQQFLYCRFRLTQAKTQAD